MLIDKKILSIYSVFEYIYITSNYQLFFYDQLIILFCVKFVFKMMFKQY